MDATPDEKDSMTLEPNEQEQLRAIRRSTPIGRMHDDIVYGQLAKVFRALRHPIRVRILTALASPGRTSSPRELAEEFGESLGVVSYHVRELHKVKMLQLARKVARRGAVEHYYRLSPGGWSLYGVACEVAELIRPGRHLRPRQIRR